MRVLCGLGFRPTLPPLCVGDAAALDAPRTPAPRAAPTASDIAGRGGCASVERVPRKGEEGKEGEAGGYVYLHDPPAPADDNVQNQLIVDPYLTIRAKRKAQASSA